MNRALISLHARRIASPRLFAALLVVAFVLVVAGRPSELSLSAAADAALARRGAQLDTVWLTTLLFLSPWMMFASALVSHRWRTREGEWIASRPGAAFGRALSGWSGTTLGLSLLLAGIALVAETGSSAGAGEPLRAAGFVPGPAVGRLTDEGKSFTIDAARARPGTRARVEVRLAPGGPPRAGCSLIARRGTTETRASAVLHARGRLELELPRGSGPVELILASDEHDSRLFVARPTCELFVPATSEHLASLAMLAHLVPLFAAWIALGIGIGTWMGPAFAGAVVGALWLRGLEMFPASPGSGLSRALDVLREGRVPDGPGTAVLAASCAWVLAGLVLAAAGRAGKAARR